MTADWLSERYEVEDELGRGGMAIVYLATDHKHDRQVAIKVLRPELTASLGADRFLREIAIVGKLAHPHILPMYDSGESDGKLFFVMPFIDGETLRDRLRKESQLALTDAVRIAREVAGGLNYAHRLDVIHRDIKPENILLSAGLAVIADFGIARAVTEAGNDDLTGTGLAIGTPDYMSPEQGSGDHVDARTDVYALGCLFYEMLVGEPPFSGQTAQATIARHSMAPVPHVRTVRDAVPEQIDDVISCALAKVPADRFASAAEFADALDGALTPKHSQTVSQHIPKPVARNSLAVLPFVNLSGDSENEFLSDGISEEIILSLAKISGINVVARTSAFAFKGKDMDVRKIGEQLNVAGVLEGSMRRAGNRLRINAQLINTADGFEIWSERFDRELTDVFEVQDSIAGAIAEALNVKLLDNRRDFDSGTEDFGAYELYLKGRFLWNRRTPDDMRQSVAMMRSAIDRDPQFTLAHSGLADAYTIMGIYGMLPPREVMPNALDAAQAALEIEPTHTEALTARGCVRAMYEWDWESADRDFATAISQNARYTTAHQWHAINLLAPQGRFLDAHNALRIARELDPLSPVVHASRGLVYFYQRKYERALSEYQRIFEMDGDFGMAYYFAGQVYERTARYKEAIDAFTQAESLVGSTPEIVAALGHAHAASGNRGLAEERVSELTAMSQNQYVSAALIALVYVGLDEKTRALEWLSKAVEQHAPELAWLAVRPQFDPLRPKPEFDSILKTINLLGSS
jgi:serine/threonine protein kinase/tetratricopeptide (TPR) repeat protein